MIDFIWTQMYKGAYDPQRAIGWMTVKTMWLTRNAVYEENKKATKSY